MGAERGFIPCVTNPPPQQSLHPHRGSISHHGQIEHLQQPDSLHVQRLKQIVNMMSISAAN